MKRWNYKMNKRALRRCSVISALLIVAMATPISATMCEEVASELQTAVHDNIMTWKDYDRIIDRCEGIAEAERLNN